MALRLDEERIMVVGGSRGIGKAIARALAMEGVDVALLGGAIDILVNAAAHACRTHAEFLAAIVWTWCAMSTRRQVVSDTFRPSNQDAHHSFKYITGTVGPRQG